MIKLNEDNQYFFDDIYSKRGFCWQRTFEYLDNWYVDEDTHELNQEDLCEGIINCIENYTNADWIWKAMYEEYNITEKHTVHFHRKVESVVWDGFKTMVNTIEYKNTADMSGLSRHLKKWLEMRSNETGDAIYNVLNPCYEYFRKERAEKEQEILNKENK